jgi:glycosyl transferase family 2
MDPRFSIVIPTRNRPHTLEFTLQTCLSQAWDDLEIIVSDNGTTSRTRELVDRIPDQRLRYFRTPELLAMTDSHEFALAQAKGEYVMFQGDDDGLLRHTLPVIDKVLRATDAALLRWDAGVYNWPDLSNPNFEANTLLLPLTQTRGRHALQACNSWKMIDAAANGHVNYTELPVIYNAVIRRDVLEKLRYRVGRVFKTRAPDLYTAFALAAMVDDYHSLRAPLGLSGRSANSTGVARHFCKQGSPIDDEFRRLNAKAGLQQHSWVPDLPPLALAVADAFLWCKEDLFREDGPCLDRRQLVRNSLRELAPGTADEWPHIVTAFRTAMKDNPELLKWFDSEYARVDFTALPKPSAMRGWQRYGGDYLYLDTREFGVRNIDDAAALCERLLGYERYGLHFRLEDTASDQTSLSVLQEKEALIHEKEALIHEKEALIHEQEAVLQEQAALINKNDALLHEKEAVIQELNDELKRQSARLQTAQEKLNFNRDKSQKLKNRTQKLKKGKAETLSKESAPRWRRWTRTLGARLKGLVQKPDG